tara:strand:+ start:2006 stop:2245 length:240 start_codon:yes stop_codon:yes gene_type:complete
MSSFNEEHWQTLHFAILVFLISTQCLQALQVSSLLLRISFDTVGAPSVLHCTKASFRLLNKSKTLIGAGGNKQNNNHYN